MGLDTFIGGSPAFTNLNGAFSIVILAWTLAWKGLALWRATKREEKIWFIILLIVNTFGILDLIYYLFVAKTEKKSRK